MAMTGADIIICTHEHLTIALHKIFKNRKDETVIVALAE